MRVRRVSMSSRALSRRPVFVAVATAGLAAALLTPQAEAISTPGQRSAAAVGISATPSSRAKEHAARGTGFHDVTLLTGDQVRLRTLGDGRSTATLLAGSPSIGKRVQTYVTPTATYVVPTMSAADRRRVDISVFNVTALAKLSAQGQTPTLALSFKEGSAAHDLPGVNVAESSSTLTRSGDLLSHGSYLRDGQGLTDTLGKAWDDVESVSLPAGAAAPAAPGYQLRTLTVNVNNPHGNPVVFSDAFVQNVDNGRLFLAPVAILDGSVKVSVPEGHYSIIAGGFGNWTIVEPEFTVDGDTSVTLNAADATVRPTESVDGTRPNDTTVSINRTSERGGTFSWELGGSSFFSKVTPAPVQPDHGSLDAFVAATLAPRHGGPDSFASPKKIVLTKDVTAGIPNDMRFVHTKSDFARLTHNYYGSSRSRETFAFYYGFASFERFAFILGVTTDLPSRRAVWLQGNPDLRWLQDVEAFLQFRPPFGDADMSAPIASYSPGKVSSPLQFLRGPVGPGLERRLNSPNMGPRCSLCRTGDRLHGSMPLFNSAGTTLSGFLFGNSLGLWTLTSGFRGFAGGHFLIAPDVTLPAAKKTYTLRARSHPHIAAWRLSTEVDDTWTFSSKSGHGVVPLLMASYVPPTNLSGYLAPGHVGYRLDLENLGPVGARVAKVALKYSTDDGHSWRKASLHRLDKNSFRVSYTNPSPRRGHHFVSLLVTAKDAAGRSVTERANRAYQINRAHQPQPPAGQPSPSHADHGQADGATRACDARGTRTYNCFALIERSGNEALNKAGDPAGWGARELRDAYAIPTRLSSDQTVGVVVAFNYPSAETDMNKYRRQFGLPQCTSASGCFTKINQRGVEGNYPFADQGWALEAALDLQMISASCPTCHIVLAEADFPFDRDLNKATDAAVAAGAHVTNHSYGVQEYNGIVDSNPHYAVDGVTAVAATGDFGYQPASFPASSPDVVAVGGTVLHHAGNARGWRENAWRFGGSGCSAYFDKPVHQDDTACTNRTFSDVSAVADGLAVYDSFGYGRQHGWFVLGGTSASSPLVAGMIGAAGTAGLKPGALYGDSTTFHDIARGFNGFCRGSYICTAVPGYDGPTGWGTPRGLDPFTQEN